MLKPQDILILLKLAARGEEPWRYDLLAKELGMSASEVHAGFIVNRGGATASDVNQLMDLIQQNVKERFGVVLEPELRVIGA